VRYVNQLNGKKDIFRTVYNYAKLNSERVNYESAFIDRVFFDFDGNLSYKGAKKFIKFLQKDNIKFKVNFSGEGFHIFVKTTPLQSNNPREMLRLTQEKLLDTYNLKQYVDSHILGDIARLYRLPNTWNVTKGRYCIPLTPDDFTKTYSEIKEMALKPRFIKQSWIGEKEIPPVMVEQSQSLTKDITSTQISDVEPCIQRILEKRNPSHIERFVLVTWLSDKFRKGVHIRNVDKDSLVREICCYIEKLDWSDYDPRRTEYQVRNIIYKNINNMYSHEKRKQLGICPGYCIQYEIDKLLR